MGTADVVPGVSGGTMALLLGIYPKLIQTIASFNLTSAKHALTFNFKALEDDIDWGFIISLFFGIVCAIIIFTQVIPLPYYMRHYPEYVYGLFFGLIVGSIFVLMLESGKPSFWGYGFIALGILVGWWVANQPPGMTPDGLWFIFVCGFIAITAMLLPGISGSFILLILGKYSTILQAIKEFDAIIIGTFAAGAMCGIISLSRLLSYLLKQHYSNTLLTMKGLLIGSLWMLWPFQQREFSYISGKEKLIASSPYLPETFDQTTLISIALALGGCVAVLAMHAMAHRK